MPSEQIKVSDNQKGSQSVSNIKVPLDEDGNTLKPCCACPDTRKARDNCVILRGEEYCSEYIKAHQDCLRSYGFIIE